MEAKLHGDKRVTIRASEDLVHRFDMAILEAKTQGKLPMNYNRSEAIRQMMHKIAEEPSLLPEYDAE
jgi:metal-responsive CopG/Arc/MetJ family transcriptional regulator